MTHKLFLKVIPQITFWFIKKHSKNQKLMKNMQNHRIFSVAFLIFWLFKTFLFLYLCSNKNWKFVQNSSFGDHDRYLWYWHTSMTWQKFLICFTLQGVPTIVSHGILACFCPRIIFARCYKKNGVFTSTLHHRY